MGSIPVGAAAMSSPLVIIVIPTYNERDNLPVLIKELAELELAHWQALIVDDNSPDGTGPAAEELSQKYPLTVVHQESKMGIGRAYQNGFATALAKKPDIIVQMDADLSHNPRVITQMIEQLQNYDLVIGSRYVLGGSISNWQWSRRVISKFANLFVRWLLRSKIHDLTGGFKAFSRFALERLPLKQLSSVGYNFQIEVNIVCERLGLAIKEVPIIFTERKIGQSKFNIRIILESAWRVFLLFFKDVFKIR